MTHLIENVREFFISKKKFIPTKFKIQYINQLMEVGYFAIDIGEFGSQHFQFSDLEEVINGVENKNSTQVLVKITDLQQFEKALQSEKINLIEIPFSLFEELDFLSFPEKIIVNFEDEASFLNLEKCCQKSVKWFKICQKNNLFPENLLNQLKNHLIETQIIIDFYHPDFQFFETSIKNYAGGVSTEKMLTCLSAHKEKTQIQMLALETACNTAKKIFSEF